MLKWGMIRFSISLAVWEGEKQYDVVKEGGSPCGCGWKRKVNECIERKQTLQCPCLEKVLLCYSVSLAPCLESVGQIHSRACFPELHLLLTKWTRCFLHVTCLEARPVMLYFFLLEYDLEFHRTTVSRPCDIASKALEIEWRQLPQERWRQSVRWHLCNGHLSGTWTVLERSLHSCVSITQCGHTLLERVSVWLSWPIPPSRPMLERLSV